MKKPNEIERDFSDPAEPIYPPATIVNYDKGYEDKLKMFINSIYDTKERPKPDEMIEDFDGLWLAVDCNGNVIGRIGFSRISQDVGRLRRMAVAQNWRGKNLDGNEISADIDKSEKVSRKLVQKVLEFAKECGCKIIYLKTGENNIGAQNLYKDAGFVKVEDKDFDTVPEGIRKEITKKKSEKQQVDYVFKIEI